MSKRSSQNDLFVDKRFDVEHALSLYAYSFVSMPAVGLYDADKLKAYEQVLDTCHIYFIGFIPKVTPAEFSQKGKLITISLTILGQTHELVWEFPQSATLRSENARWFVESADGRRYAPTEDQLLMALRQQHGPLNFDVKYIGQAYGRDGTRTSLKRLLQHETLQKIALRGAPEGYSIGLLMAEVHPNTQVLTIFNPHAKEKDETGQRTRAGLDKLFGTSEQERIALYEAAMIRYFKPVYNVEFKNSFPSTRLKILQDCYEKDFSAVIAEFAFDAIPFVLCSDSVEPRDWHLASYDLHDEQERRVFFGV